MGKVVLKNGLVIGIIFLFAGASVLPSISGFNNQKYKNIDNINLLEDWLEQDILKATYAELEDTFGHQVSIDGDTAIIGAYLNDDYGLNSGSAYIFVRSGSTWIQQEKLLPSDGAPGDYFGVSVSIYEDTAVVGAELDDDLGDKSGSVYVFTRSGDTWTQQAKLLPSDGKAKDLFGYTISIYGETVIVGAPQNIDQFQDVGSAYVFMRSGDTWTQQAKLLPSDGEIGDYFGVSVSIYEDTAVVGAFLDDDLGEYSGSAYVFTRSGDTWTQQAKLLASDGAIGTRFGYRVSTQEKTTIISAWDGFVYIFSLLGENWIETVKLHEGSQWFGISTQIDDDRIIIGDSTGGHLEKGSAYVFTKSGDTWTQQAKLLASDGDNYDWFGYSVSLSGCYAIIGAPRNDEGGSAYIFKAPNQPPNPPNINGYANGKPGIIYDYDFNDCVDPDGDDMTYHVEWGDGVVDEGFVASGGAFTLSHKWYTKGDYQIKAKLIDDYGAESDWATFDVNIPRTKTLFNQPFQYLFSRFTNLSPILKIIKGFK